MSDYTLAEGFPHILLVEGMKLRITAVSPTTGAVVTGVVGSVWSVYGEDVSGASIEDVIPLYTPTDAGTQQ